MFFGDKYNTLNFISQTFLIKIIFKSNYSQFQIILSSY